MLANLFDTIANFFRRLRFDQRQSVINAYDKTLSSPRPSVFDAFKIGLRLIVFSVTSPEAVLLSFTYGTIFIFVGSFLSPDASLFPPTTIFLLLNLVVGLSAIMVSSSIILPLKILFELNTYSVNTIISAISAGLLVLLAPYLWAFTNDELLVYDSFTAMFVGYYVLTNSVLLIVYIYNREIMDYYNYRQTKEKKYGGFELPFEVRGAVLMARAQDHYVEVTTDLGKHLVRMRMSDALKRLENLNGIQTHRSYWVAKGQIAELGKDGARNFARLRTGEEIPVSVSQIKKVRQWMEES